MQSTSYPLSAKYFSDSKTSVTFRFDYSFSRIADIVRLFMIIVLYCCCALFVSLVFSLFYFLINKSYVA